MRIVYITRCIVVKKNNEGVMFLYYPRLRDLREDKDLTQIELVQILGMHKTTYTNYEQGKRDIPFSLAIRLAKFYNVSLDYIAGLTTEPIPIDKRNMKK